MSTPISTFQTKTMENLMSVAELTGIALHEIRKSFYINDETSEKTSKKISKFISDIKNIVDGISKSVKAFLQFSKPTNSTTQQDENLPYPKEMADMLAGMTPADFNFIKSLQPEIAKMMGA